MRVARARRCRRDTAFDNRFSLALSVQGVLGTSDAWRQRAIEKFSRVCPNAALLFFDYAWQLQGPSFIKHELDMQAYRRSG